MDQPGSSDSNSLEPPPRRSRDYTSCLPGCLLPIVILAVFLFSRLGDSYRRVPQPPGLQLQVELPPNHFLRLPKIEPIPERPGCFAFHLPNYSTKTWATRIYSYPGGELLENSESDVPPPKTAAPPTDFDGDGTPDRFGNTSDDTNIVLLIGSEPDGAELFRFAEPRTAGGSSEIFPLGDLDQDGFGEVAIYHWRSASSDDHFWRDLFHMPKSWISIVSMAP